MDEILENKNPDSGGFVLEFLKKWGSDVNRKHEFTFWLYFPEEEQARKAGRKAEDSGFGTEILPPLEDMKNPAWLCLLYCPHIPDEELMDGIINYSKELAREFNGKFDGWETMIELPEGMTAEDFIKNNDLKEIDDIPE